VVVSALLFTLAHGALLIPAILLMGFALGVVRRTRTLWFTMGAHAAWNLVIVTIAAAVLLGGATRFSSSDGVFSLEHPASWESSQESRKVFGTIPELTLGSARGSFAMFTYEPALEASAQATLATVVSAVNGTGVMKGSEQTEILPTDVDFSRLGAEAYEVGFVSPGATPDQPVFSTLVVVQRPQEKGALFAEFRCVRSACMDDVHDFESMLDSVDLALP